MGDYLLLQWLSTRRGFAVFIFLVLITASSNLCRYAKRDQVHELKDDDEGRRKLSQRVMMDRGSVPKRPSGGGARLGSTPRNAPGQPASVLPSEPEQ